MKRLNIFFVIFLLINPVYAKKLSLSDNIGIGIGSSIFLLLAYKELKGSITLQTKILINAWDSAKNGVINTENLAKFDSSADVLMQKIQKKSSSTSNFSKDNNIKKLLKLREQVKEYTKNNAVELKTGQSIGKVKKGVRFAKPDKINEVRYIISRKAVKETKDFIDSLKSKYPDVSTIKDPEVKMLLEYVEKLEIGDLLTKIDNNFNSEGNLIKGRGIDPKDKVKIGQLEEQQRYALERFLRSEDFINNIVNNKINLNSIKEFKQQFYDEISTALHENDIRMILEKQYNLSSKDIDSFLNGEKVIKVGDSYYSYNNNKVSETDTNTTTTDPIDITPEIVE